jgi:spore germination protein
MDIHVVQPGDTIKSIADQYNVTVTRLIQDNGLTNPDNLVTGQTLIVLYPKQTYTVKEGDTLTGIADSFGVTTMQLLRNNPYLSDREFIFPGEEIIISYDTDGFIGGYGYAFAYINMDILKKTLPYLTTLSIYNYRTGSVG